MREGLSRHPLLIAGLVCLSVPAAAQDNSDQSAPAPAEDNQPEPKRPAILMNRWQEDWSVLADPALRTHVLDDLKYIPLSANDPKTYLSLGANWRTRFETSNAPGFNSSQEESYVINRVEANADLHVGPVQVFAQLQNDFAPGKKYLTPVDSDRLDLEQGFIALVVPVGSGTFKGRVGRQQFAFDLQRFVGVRDGPNVRQSFDALWVDYEIGPWRFIGYYTQPVAVYDRHPFDDRSSGQNRFYGLRAEWRSKGNHEFSGYWSRFTNDNASFLSVSGMERRDVWDLRSTGTVGRIDWDAEFMAQTGHVASKRIRAWAIGTRAGYTFADSPLQPRLGVQLDAASGDRNREDATLGTFNPLFPNGFYFTLAGYTGYANLVHAKTSLTVKPTKKVTVTGAVAGQWRLTTGDAVYLQPSIPVPGTAGVGGRWTGAYGQIQIAWAVSGQLSAALEADHFGVGSTVHNAGGEDSNYLGLQLGFAW